MKKNIQIFFIGLFFCLLYATIISTSENLVNASTEANVCIPKKKILIISSKDEEGIPPFLMLFGAI